jgi:hypothetical protein
LILAHFAADDADEKKKDCEKDIGRVEIMMEEESSNTKRAAVFKNRRVFLDVVLSWSLEDIENENLYSNQV